MTAAAFLAEPVADPATELREDLQRIILAHEEARPRSRQAAIGPSGVGEPCVRKIGYQLAGAAKVNRPDRWASITGTAVHSMLEAAVDAERDRLLKSVSEVHTDLQRRNPGRWLTETRVQITPLLAGSVDLFDTWTGRVIDHKNTGATGMKAYRGHGMKPGQRIQTNLYGYGMKLAGHEVREIACAYYLLGGRLSDMHVVVEPYDEDIALDALTRLGNIRALAAGLELDVEPSRIALMPATPSSLCDWCDFYRYRSTDVATGCPGASL